MNVYEYDEKLAKEITASFYITRGQQMDYRRLILKQLTPSGFRTISALNDIPSIFGDGCFFYGIIYSPQRIFSLPQDIIFTLRSKYTFEIATIENGSNYYYIPFSYKVIFDEINVNHSENTRFLLDGAIYKFE